ncbi:MAG: membrane protein [Rhodocyclaceae bacterium]|uniref:peptidoglycan lytic exotransglycosylase n=1 Tax=Candidatus Desulfobacillus denitrificans TaxID=2608985 RepID=A0A809QYN3_9PROT|nr:murein transglycosylase [Candidatus Desulfobacillus denitrificans]GIK45674.1 MAG: membrane protein [Betaproteobacteria bacterium]GJQ56210.1 MAG: membrane protein [Rhodocyclaceae bacterium]
MCPAVAPPKPPAKPLQEARWEDVKGWGADNLAEAHGALLESCGALAKQPAWREACEAARALPAENAALRAFFETRFRPWRVVNPDESTEGLVTGYYEPLLRGSRERSKSFSHAIYGVPDDLLVVDLGELYPELKNFRLRGRLDGRRVVPYWPRAELTPQSAALAGKALLWVADPIELFFLQVQGSGRVELPDGRRVRVGYADQNGHPYQSIGRWLVDKGELKLEDASMQGIQAWARANPKRLNELLNVNPSFVFFRELPDNGGGPPGALGVPLTPGRSIAVDPRTVPLGAPVFLATTQPASGQPMQRLVLAQDTGGAIKGAVRADFFWGFGAEAGAQAGRMRQKGEMWVLLPSALVPENSRKQ